jgi:hypothetical protein
MLFFKKIYKIIILSVILFNLFILEASAFEDGFGHSRRWESRHFAVFLQDEVVPEVLIRQLDIRPADELLAGRSSQEDYSVQNELLDMLDTLFIKICNILDMQLYSFQGTIKICKNTQQLNQIYKQLFNKEPEKLSSFYVYSLNTIYITQQDFKLPILGHEVAHAIISHYFVVQPSVKIQEILAGYVEYQLRKK